VGNFSERGQRKTPVLAAACVLAAVACSSSLDSSDTRSLPTSAVSSDSRKPDILDVTQSMIVGRESFPASGSARWNGPRIDPHSNDGGTSASPPADPAECGPLLFGAPAPATGKANLVAEDNRRFSVEISVPTQRPDFDALVDKCETVERGDRRFNFERASIADLPDWSTSVHITIESREGQGTGIYGYYRGVLIFVEVSGESPTSADDTTAGLIFNDQVAKLETV
jgi:hypothetical protein